jgi:EAL domain-containing protein (putative c-di-GMP-specific phosphodiesterase class I)
MQHGEYALQVSASIGATFFPQSEDIDAEQLLRQADQAMYQAKIAGKNRYHLFDADKDLSVRGFHESLARIRRALQDDEFILYYQPKINMRSEKIVGAEALIRWRHPQRGLLPPSTFLPLIEDQQLAIQLGDWVIQSAVAQMAQWQQDGILLPVSVNVGGLQLQQADFIDKLQQTLASHAPLPSGHLSMEVLETTSIEDLALIAKVIHDCGKLGIGFALDDFGTGYSSLTYLRHLPVKQLKIDQSFVRDMLDDADDLSILKGVIGLARAFNREVLAEGVESTEHGHALLALGCELAQGYGIARPMPASEIPTWVRNWAQQTAWLGSGQSGLQ